MKKIIVGTKVRWTSQAGGLWKKKTGEVVEVVPAGTLPQTSIIGAGMERNHESYIVNVRVGPKNMKSYWPRIRSLEVVGIGG